MYFAVMAVLIGLFGIAVLDSTLRNHSNQYLKPLKDISTFLPSADVGMDNSARYVRHLGLATSASAFADFPGQPDYLPAGMVCAPPNFADTLQTKTGIHEDRYAGRF